jgi:hypothetical protein
MPTKSKIQDQTFLFTGTLTEFTRNEAEALVEANGGKVLSGVTAKLNFLVVGEDAGSKLAKAEALGTVTILHEKEFLKMMSSGKKAPAKATPKKIVKVTPQKEKVNSKTASDKTKKTKVFIGKKLLDVKTAKKSISDFVDLSEFDSIDPKAAAILAAEDSSLFLNGLKYLDVETAIALAKQEGENHLTLNGLEELDQDVAEELAKHNGALDLNGLRSISPEVAKELSKLKFDITLDGIEEMEDASSFINHSALLNLCGLKNISDKVADQLCKKKGEFDLRYDISDSFKELSPAQAKLLVKFYSDSEITLETLEVLSLDAAKELAKHNNSISLNLSEISIELLNVLSKVHLSLNNVNKLSIDYLKTIANFKKGISLNGLQEIDFKAVNELVKVGTRLELLGVDSITDHVAKILASFKGELYLGCKTLSEKSAEYLGDVKRKAGKNELHLPNIESPSSIEGKGVDFLMKEGITLLRDFPKLDFNAERVVGLCYALKGGLDYAWEIDSDTWDAVKEDNEEFGTFREIAKSVETYCDDWVPYFPEALKKNFEFYNQLADSCKKLPIKFIELADEKIKTNKELMMKFLKSNQSIHHLLEVVGKKLQDDKDYVLEAVRSKHGNLRFASKRLQDDTDVINCLLLSEGGEYSIEYASDKFRANKEIAARVLLKSGSVLQYFDSKIKEDSVLVKMAVNNDPSAIQYASKELISDKEFLLTLNRFNLTNVPKKLFSDQAFLKGIIESIYQHYLLTENGLDSEEAALLIDIFKKRDTDKETFKKLLVLSDDFVSEIPEILKNDLEIAKILISRDVSNMESLSAAIRKNKEIKALFEHIENRDFEGMSDEDLTLIVRYSGNRIIDYENFKPFAKAIKTLDDAKRLVKRVTGSYAHLSPEFKRDKVVAEIASSKCENLKSFPKELLDDTDFIGYLLEKDPFILEYLPAKYQKDKAVALSVLNIHVMCFKYIDKSLQSDSELIDLVITNRGDFYDLRCLEKMPDAIKGQRDFAVRIAENGYVLKKYRMDKEIVLTALKSNPNASITVEKKNGNFDVWNNDLEVALLAPYRGNEPITEESALYNRPNLIAVKFLEQILNTDADNLDIDAIEFIRASGYDFFIDNQIPKQDYEENDYDDDEDSNEDSDEEDYSDED